MANVFEAAKDRFGRAGEYPLIDDAETIEERVVFDSWPWVQLNRRGSGDELFGEALRSGLDDLPVRFVYLNLFFRLAHYPAEEIAEIREDQESAADHRAQFLGYLENLIRLVDPNRCEGPRNVRWEIVNACCIRDWALVRQLYDRLEALVEEHEVGQVHAQRGQQEFLSAFATPWELNDPYCWAPLLVEGSGTLRYILIHRCARDRSAPTFSDDELERLRDAAHHLEKAARTKPNLSPVFRFLLLRCNLVLGRFQEAARVCEELLATRKSLARYELDDDGADGLVSHLYARLVEAASSAGDIDRAISANLQWIEEFPDEPGTFEQLSTLFRSQGDFINAYDYLRKEVDRNPARGDDPAISMALSFGAVYKSTDTRIANFEKQVDPEKLRQMGIIVRLLWPQVEELNTDAVEDWVRACHCLFCRSLDDSRLPVFYLGRLLDSELRERVFDRFRGSLGQSELQSIRDGAETDPLTRYLENGRLTLGEMLNEFRYWDLPRSRASRQFRGWLDRENPGLVPSLRKIDLQRSVDLHNREKHRSETPLSWNDATDMARLCRGLLSAVIEHGGAVKTN